MKCTEMALATNTTLKNEEVPATILLPSILRIFFIYIPPTRFYLRDVSCGAQEVEFTQKNKTNKNQSLSQCNEY